MLASILEALGLINSMEKKKGWVRRVEARARTGINKDRRSHPLTGERCSRPASWSLSVYLYCPQGGAGSQVRGSKEVLSSSSAWARGQGRNLGN
jgi:hypothetical protein